MQIYMLEIQSKVTSRYHLLANRIGWNKIWMVLEANLTLRNFNKTYWNKLLPKTQKLHPYHHLIPNQIVPYNLMPTITNKLHIKERYPVVAKVNQRKNLLLIRLKRKMKSLTKRIKLTLKFYDKNCWTNWVTLTIIKW